MFSNCRESGKYFMSPDWHSAPLLSPYAPVTHVWSQESVVSKCLLCHFLAVWPWRSHLTSLSIRLLSVKCQEQWSPRILSLSIITGINEMSICFVNSATYACHMSHIATLFYIPSSNSHLSPISTNSNSPVLFFCSLPAPWIYPTCFCFLSIHLHIYLAVPGLSCGPRDL